jgi:peroxiredoxin
MRPNLNELPPHLPRPIDDGQTDHLQGFGIPSLKLKSTEGRRIDLCKTFEKPTVLFIFPAAGSPLEPNTNPDLWDSIPGARGCTPQSCGFRDLLQDFTAFGVQVYGLSVQSPLVQSEFIVRNHISFPILSDCEYEMTNLLRLPTFDFEGKRLIKRMAFFINASTIEKVFYPVFPPDKNAEEVLDWLKKRKKKTES